LDDDVTGVWLDGIAQSQQADEAGVGGESEDGSALSGPMSHKRGTRIWRGLGCPVGRGVLTAPQRAGDGPPDHATFAQPVK